MSGVYGRKDALWQKNQKKRLNKITVHDEIVFPINMLISINIFVIDNDQFFINMNNG